MTTLSFYDVTELCRHSLGTQALCLNGHSLVQTQTYIVFPRGARNNDTDIMAEIRHRHTEIESKHNTVADVRVVHLPNVNM